MRKNRIRNVEIHVADDADWVGLRKRIGEFHVAAIERRIQQSGLSAGQGIALIERIMDNRRAEEARAGR